MIVCPLFFFFHTSHSIMVFFTQGPRLREAVAHAAQCCGTAEADREMWRSYEGGATMPHETVAALCAHLAACAEWQGAHAWCRVHEAVRDADVAVAPDVQQRLARPPPEALTEEQVRHRLAIRAKAADDAYRRMVQNVSQQSAFDRATRRRRHIPQSAAEIAREEAEESVRSEMKLMTDNSYLAINLIVAMVACFAVGFYVGRTVWKSSPQAPWVCGIVGLVGALFVEAVLFIIKLARQDAFEANKIREARSLRAQRRPVRPIVHEIPVPGRTPAAGAAETKPKDD